MIFSPQYIELALLVIVTVIALMCGWRASPLIRATSDPPERGGVTHLILQRKRGGVTHDLGPGSDYVYPAHHQSLS